MDLSQRSDNASLRPKFYRIRVTHGTFPVQNDLCILLYCCTTLLMPWRNDVSRICLFIENIPIHSSILSRGFTVFPETKRNNQQRDLQLVGSEAKRGHLTESLVSMCFNERSCVRRHTSRQPHDPQRTLNKHTSTKHIFSSLFFFLSINGARSRANIIVHKFNDITLFIGRKENCRSHRRAHTHTHGRENFHYVRCVQ